MKNLFCLHKTILVESSITNYIFPENELFPKRFRPKCIIPNLNTCEMMRVWTLSQTWRNFIQLTTVYISFNARKDSENVFMYFFCLNFSQRESTPKSFILYGVRTNLNVLLCPCPCQFSVDRFDWISPK